MRLLGGSTAITLPLMRAKEAGRCRQPLELEVGDGEARAEVILAADLIRDPVPTRLVISAEKWVLHQGASRVLAIRLV